MAKRAKKAQSRKKQSSSKRSLKRSGQPAPREAVHKTKVRVIGIGGGGGNIVAEIAKSVGRADFVAANTDLQATKGLAKNVRSFTFGQDFTKGLGCGMDVELGERAAKAEKERIKKLMEGQDICVLVVSLGGGTGSGASGVFAEAAKEAKCLTLGILTTPFSFEGQKRAEIASKAKDSIVPFMNTYAVLPNENIFRVIDQKTPLKEAFSAVNKHLAATLEGFIETISLPGLINIDFADIRTLLEGRGRLAYINSVESQGEGKVQLAIKDVLHNPLLNYGIQGVDRMVFNVTGDKAMKMQEVAEVSRAIAEHNLKARIIFGISFQNNLKNKLRISLFAVGCKEGSEKAEPPAAKPHKEQKPAQQKKAAAPKKPAQATRKKKTRKKKAKKEAPASLGEPMRVRRNALDVRKAQDEELKELEKKERQWDIPAFLRNARRQET